MIDNDDRLVGRILTRREALALLGAASAAMLAACAPGQSTTTQPTSAAAEATPLNTEAKAAAAVSTNPTAVATTQQQATTVAAANATALPTCIVRPELTEGPYFVDEKLNRADIRPDPSTGKVSEGIPLQLVLNVSQIGASGCTPLQGAQVDVWHCDALGVYSDVQDNNFGSTRGTKFLRGYQLTDANGQATFTTIYPGWYPGRAVHIHFKIRNGASYQQVHEFTSQFFFDESVTDQVHAQLPYSQKGYRTLKNEGDGIYRGGGSQLLLKPTKASDGYATSFDIGLQTS